MDKYLEHHGILGQKWGKRSGPPYPLDQRSHDSVVKSAGSAERFAAVQRGGGSAASLHTSNAGKQGKIASAINKATGMDITALKIKK